MIAAPLDSIPARTVQGFVAAVNGLLTAKKCWAVTAADAIGGATTWAAYCRYTTPLKVWKSLSQEVRAKRKEKIIDFWKTSDRQTYLANLFVGHFSPYS